jgi:hypothetical protein
VSAGERKAGGHEQRGNQNRDNKEVRAPHIEAVAQFVGDNATDQAAGRYRAADPGQVPEAEECGEGQQHKDIADNRGGLGVDRAAAEPAPAEDADGDREQERGKAKDLEYKVGAIGTDGPDPVAGHDAVVPRARAHIERNIVGGIRDQ